MSIYDGLRLTQITQITLGSIAGAEQHLAMREAAMLAIREGAVVRLVHNGRTYVWNGVAMMTTVNEEVQEKAP